MPKDKLGHISPNRAKIQKDMKSGNLIKANKAKDKHNAIERAVIKNRINKEYDYREAQLTKEFESQLKAKQAEAKRRSR